jgi:tetratricopeptide (TPR) repeat protein
VNEVTPPTPAHSVLVGRVFISFATANRKQALSVCEAIERRGLNCWLSSRDVEPGENYQEAIVHSIRNARSMVLVFSEAANKSDEIKKELSLASRYRVPVIALRIEDVEPTEAFAYELSTRQWIDAFEGWDRSIDSLVDRIAQTRGGEPAAITAASHPRRRAGSLSRRRTRIAAAASLLLLVTAGGAYWWLRPSPAAAHSMMVRLAGFQLLSADLPATTRDTVNAEIAAAFNADGVIGVSTASAPPPGKAPAYALGGTIHRIGDTIRVITQLTNERSGAILWSDSVDYAAEDVTKVPHKIAVDAGIVVRCGLSGASTYHKPLPDAVLKDYMQYCQESWAYGGTKTLLPAQRVVAALPDFSWGWSAVQTGFMQAAQDEVDSQRAQQLRAAGLRAADKALALDPGNSEALDRKTYLIDPYDWVTQETLYKRAIAAKPLDCGCQHYGYGLMLSQVGRLRDAIEQQRAATDMLALWPDSQRALADVLAATNQIEEARTYYAAAVDLSSGSDLANRIAVTSGTETGDYQAAIRALRDPQFRVTEGTRAPLIAGYQALASGDPGAKAKAIRALLAVPKDAQEDRVAIMLAALGANHEALAVASRSPWLFWRRSMRGVLRDPGFPTVADQLRLMRYWKASRTKPDVCSEKDAPPFCHMI